MSRIKLVSVMTVVAVLSGGAAIFSQGFSKSGQFSAGKRYSLETAIASFEVNLDSLEEAGFMQWTPSSASMEMVDVMNAAQILLPEEEAKFRQAGKPVPEPIPYVLETPTNPWQIVVIPDEAAQKIRIEGYGMDLSQPLITKEWPCCSF